MNVANMKLSIARNVQRHVSSVRKNAGRWQLKLLMQAYPAFLYSAVEVGCKPNGRVVCYGFTL
jgi:hypothetical protein